MVPTDYHKPDSLWPLSESTTVLIALMVFAYVGFIAGWLCGAEVLR